MKTRVKTWLRICCVLFFFSFLMPALRSAPGDENWDEAFGVPGVEGRISAMAVSGSSLYVGGNFSHIGGVLATNVAHWDGTNWHALGPGLGADTRFYGGVATLLVANGELYAGGYFTNSGETTIWGLARWNGSSWNSIVSNPNTASITALGWDGRYLYAGGTFAFIGGIFASNIARWNGTNWSALGHGVHFWLTGITGGPQDYGQVHSMATLETSLIVGGQIDLAGGVRTTNLARWDGVQWSAVRQANLVNSGPLVADGSQLYTGYRGGIVKYNGTSWSALGPTNSDYPTISALQRNGSDLYAGGTFTSMGSVPVRHVAKWDGSQWSSLGQGIGAGFPGGITTMAVAGTDLFVAGVFTSAGGKPATNIARWRIPHELKIRRSADKALLSWPATGSNLFLEATLNPSEPNWTILSNPPGLHGGECVVTNPITDPARFYRLRGR